MARNAIESDFRSSKLSAGGHFVRKLRKKSGQIYGNPLNLFTNISNSFSNIYI